MNYGGTLTNKKRLTLSYKKQEALILYKEARGFSDSTKGGRSAKNKSLYRKKSREKIDRSESYILQA